MTHPQPDPVAAVLAEATAAARTGLLPESMIELFGEPIHVYTRAQALADGALVDATAPAREAGFKWPVALTRAAWFDAVAWDEATDKRKPEFTGQDETGRLWDVLTMARLAARSSYFPGGHAQFKVLRVPAAGRGVRPRLTELHLHLTGGDNGEPVLTISLPGED